jgi:BatD DUF11 like domain
VTGLLLLCLLQGSVPELEASVDHDRVSVGDEVTYVLRATSRSSEPMKLSIAPLNGFEVVSRSERTEVSFSTGPVRLTVLEIRLRALRPGRWQIGPARAIQGRESGEAAAIVVDVAPSSTVATPALNPRLGHLLGKAPPPPRGKPAVALVVSADTVNVGAQVDVVTAAWFPRDLRVQLRRPPTLQPPVIDGVWSYPQAAPSGIAATRNIGGNEYDLFVAHQVVFPLLPGTVAIPSATLKYSTPLALQFFSQEERFALSSLPETLVVQPLPASGRPSAFAGAVGAGLRLERRIVPPTVQAGEGVAVELVLSGEGNTALWPPPELKWPVAARAYVDRVEEEVTMVEGRLGGTKTFRYLVVPDSAGPLSIPAVRYPYYDLVTRDYRVASVAAASLPVAAGSEPAGNAALPPPLLEKSTPSLAWRAVHAVPRWFWLGLFVVPPLAALIRTRRPVRRRGRKPPPRTGLSEAEAKLDELVRSLLPDPDRRSRAGLAAAARAAGVDVETASRMAAIRDKLLARRYGPPDLVNEDPGLMMEVDEVVRRLGGSLRGWGGRGAILGGLMLWCGSAWAQAPPPEELYQSGALRAAAVGFERRTELEPASAAHWYNLGATHYRLGDRGNAMAAWLRARRLAPRDPTILRALRLTPSPDATSARWTWSAPATPDELIVVAAIGWLLGWGGWMLRPQYRARWMVLLIVAAMFGLSSLGVAAWYRRPIAIVLDQTPLRLSPHGRAPAVAPLEAGSAVRVLRQQRGWVLVRGSQSTEGWLPSDAIAAIHG